MRKSSGMLKMFGLLLASVLFVSGVPLTSSAASEGDVAKTADSQKKEGIEICNIVLSSKQIYKPIGYVTGALIQKLTKDQVLLFTDLYFRALGMALHKQGFDKIVNTKGVFLEQMAPGDRARTLDIVSGKSDSNIQIQGLVATEIWANMASAFKLDVEKMDASDAVLNSKKAYYASVDEYSRTRDFLLANLDQKKQIIEFIRLSLPFGIRMAVDGLGRTNGKAIFLTTLTTAGTAVVTFVASTVAAMVDSPNPGDIPLILPLVTSSFAGFSTYFYTGPKSHLRKLHIWFMNRANRKSLAKAGLISKEDGESTGLIRAVFADLKELQQQVELKDIQSVVPILPANADTTTVQTAMLSYASELGQQTAAVSAFQEMVSNDWKQNTQTLGEPVFALTRIVTVKDGKTAFQVPDNARIAIDEYSKHLKTAFAYLNEIETEYAALIQQYELHKSVLAGYYAANKGSMSDQARIAIEEKLNTIEAALVTLPTLANVIGAQKTGLMSDSTSLDLILTTIASVSGNKSMTNSQAVELKKALQHLVRTIDTASEDEVKPDEIIPTREATDASSQNREVGS